MPWGSEVFQTVTSKVKSMVDGYFDSSTEEMILLKVEITKAKKDWVCAQNYFQNVTDPDLIDHAIYLLEAAEARYTYLLKQARGISLGNSIRLE